MTDIHGWTLSCRDTGTSTSDLAKAAARAGAATGSAFLLHADLGFDVDMGPLFQTPKEAAKQA